MIHIAEKQKSDLKHLSHGKNLHLFWSDGGGWDVYKLNDHWIVFYVAIYEGFPSLELVTNDLDEVVSKVEEYV